MNRRAFITLLWGTAAAWPLTARGEHRGVPVVGYLHGAAPETYAPMLAAFRAGLKEMGYVEGQNVAIEYRWAENQLHRLPSLAAELVQRQVAVIATGGGQPPAEAAKRASTTIPVVFVTSLPVEAGLVATLSSPGGNLTGVDVFTWLLGPKRLELLRELVPNPGQIAMLINPSATEDLSVKAVQDAALAIGQPIDRLDARDEQEIDTAFAKLRELRVSALLVISDPLFTSHRHQIVALANHHRIPAVYPLREYVAAGGLISYGASITDAYRQSGVYVGRILHGAQPRDLPILQPTKFDLVINLKTAQALGITVAPSLLARADEVIE
jgi:putative ABC transport system substrate-binding protein